METQTWTLKTIENIAHYKLVENILARVCRVTARHQQADNELADSFESFDFEFGQTIYEFRVKSIYSHAPLQRASL